MLAPPEFAPYWRENLPDVDYHADMSAVSSTGIRKILKSPATFKAHILDRLSPEPTPAMQFGTLVHKAVLEGTDFLKSYVVEPEFTGYTLDGKLSTRSKDATEKRDRWRAEQALAGNLVVTQKERDSILGIVRAIIAHEDAFALLKDGVTEVSGYYRDPETGILCRIRPDFYSSRYRTLVDLKTTSSIDEDDFSWSIWNLRYDVQLAMYGEGTSIITGAPVDHHVLIAVEPEHPYEVAVYPADQAMMEIGHEDYHAALRTLKRCIETNEYPRRQPKMTSISLPYSVIQRRKVYL